VVVLTSSIFSSVRRALPFSSRSAPLRRKSSSVFWRKRARELPALEQFASAHRDDPDFELVGIVRDDSERAVRSYEPGKTIDWTVGMDPGSRAALAFGTRGQPETFAITPDGLVAGAQIGPSTRQDLETLLAAARGQRT
jgi:hypothetical protein